MHDTRTRVLVATEPLSLGSALHALLARDSRFEVVLAVDTADIATLAASADVIVVSTPYETALQTIIHLNAEPLGVEVRRGTSVERFDYEGIGWLIELLATLPLSENPTDPSIDVTEKAPMHGATQGGGGSRRDRDVELGA